jgi:ATP-binding cassette subfamily B protein
VKRLLELTEQTDPAVFVEPTAIYRRGPLPDVGTPAQRDADRLYSLHVRDLTYRHVQNGKGIEGVSLDLDPGTLTVVTGRVGSGKSTLLRVLLGLLPRDAGSIRWNGNEVHDPASFFVPPRCAYTPQVPRLFSMPLRENVLLGLPQEEVDLQRALNAAVLGPDIPQLEKGLDTVVGPRGVKLSGGQVQRTAAARMFVRQPALLVFDDLSSALDVETEAQLWEGLLARANSSSGETNPTILAVSHRRAALQRADRVIVMAGGRVEGVGPLADLLRESDEMQRIWKRTAQR